MKIISALKMIGVTGTILTSIPLLSLYIMDIEPSYRLMIHLHIWFGQLSIIFAITNMILNKRQAQQKI